MKINWKDIALMYCVGIVSLFFGGVLALYLDSYNPILGLLFVPIPLLLPGLFFFSRNPHELKEAALISAVFGFTLIPAYVIVLGLPMFILALLIFQKSPDLSVIMSQVSLAMVLAELLIEGIIFTVPTVLAYLICKHLFGKPPKEKPQVSKPKHP